MYVISLCMVTCYYCMVMLEYMVHTQYKHFLVYNVSTKLKQIL